MYVYCSRTQSINNRSLLLVPRRLRHGGGDRPEGTGGRDSLGAKHDHHYAKAILERLLGDLVGRVVCLVSCQ